MKCIKCNRKLDLLDLNGTGKCDSCYYGELGDLIESTMGGEQKKQQKVRKTINRGKRQQKIKRCAGCGYEMIYGDKCANCGFQKY